MKLGMISLGCDKNRVDSEKMLYKIANSSYEIVQDKDLAEIIIINSCGFIDIAKEETIDTILEMNELKKNNLKYLVVTGCFATRYKSEVEMPEVDLWVSIKDEENIVSILDKLTNANKNSDIENRIESEGRILTTPSHYAYLKIADGCDKRCAYCAIPNIRGKYISRPIEKIVAEAKTLISEGVRELILVAQDTGCYGIDIYKEKKLVELLSELVKLDVWKIRLLYVYPEEINDALIDFIAKNEKMAKYLDIPMQHINDTVLRKMNRKSDRNKIEDIIKKIKEKNKDIVIRSSFIVGFPYETEKEHKELVEFVKSNIDYAGFFEFSREEGTIAYDYPESADKKTMQKWINECEKAQCLSTINSHQKYLNEIKEVLYEGIDYDKQMFVGRTEQNAPDIDTNVYFTSSFPLEIGQIYKVKITKADFDLYGETII